MYLLATSININHMARVTTFSRQYPQHHVRAGEPTYFVEKILVSFKELGISLPYKKELPLSFLESLALDKFSPKHHTIREGHRFKVGDTFSPRVWAGKPYLSKQLVIGPDIAVKKVWNFKIEGPHFILNDKYLTIKELTTIANNDGLTIDDFLIWFDAPHFDGQIICWNDALQY